MTGIKHCSLGEVGPVRMCKRIMKDETSEQGDIPFFKIGTFGGVADVFISRDKYEEYKAKYPYPRKGDVLISAAGTIGRLVVFDGTESYFQDCNIVWVENDERTVLNSYLYYALKLARWKPSQGSTILRLYNDDIRAVSFYAHESKDAQRAVANLLSALDRKIALNRRKIATLEKMAKEIYDYWFVQYDFPDANGRPYKSSGGEMVYSPELKREIPKGWRVDTLRSRVKSVETGEWGSDKATDDVIEVHCLRDADMVDQSSLPRRFITRKKAGKLLSIGDLVVEISGGSPTQATGRICHVTEGLLKSYQGNLTCTNFCNSIKLEQPKEVASFYMLWKRLYAAGVMFGFEGKTSGLKNLQIDSFLSLKWDFAPLSLAEKYNELYDKMVAACDDSKQIIARCEQIRDFLLPLLMNGQVKVGE